MSDRERAMRDEEIRVATAARCAEYLRRHAAKFDDAVAFERNDPTGTRYAFVKQRTAEVLAERIEHGEWRSTWFRSWPSEEALSPDPLTEDELRCLRKLDGPPPLETVVMSSRVPALAIRAAREINLLRDRLEEFMGVARAAAEDVEEYTTPHGTPTWDDRRVGHMMARDRALAGFFRADRLQRDRERAIADRIYRLGQSRRNFFNGDRDYAPLEEFWTADGLLWMTNGTAVPCEAAAAWYPDERAYSEFIDLGGSD